MAALLAFGFATSSYAGKPAARKAGPASAAGIDGLPAPKPAKWTAAQCAANCSKAKCKGLADDADETTPPTPAQTKTGMTASLGCALNCKAPDKAATMVDCVVGAYAANCLAIKAAVAKSGKLNRLSNCQLLSNGISAIVVGAVYIPRDNTEKPEAATAWAALKALETTSAAAPADAAPAE